MRQIRLASGQSVVEFALVLPLLLILLLGIADLARIHTTMLTVESAAREAADYGAFGSYQWRIDPPPGQIGDTIAEMKRRACTAASDLPDYEEPAGTVDHADCTNPSFAFALCLDPAPDPDASCTVPVSPTTGACYDDPADPPKDPPCTLTVTLGYDFRLLAPLSFEAFGVHYGLPQSLPFERTSTFAMSDLTLPASP